MRKKNLDIAKAQLKDRERERDKIVTHRKEWTKETVKEMQVIETRAEDELGSTMYLSKFSQKKGEERRELRME